MNRSLSSSAPTRWLRAIIETRAWLALSVALLLGAGLASWAAWRDAVRHGNAEAFAEMLSARTPPRPGEAPGASAWMTVLLRESAERLPRERRAAFRAMVNPTAEGELPEPLARALGDALRQALEPIRPVPLSAAPSASRSPSDVDLRAIELTLRRLEFWQAQDDEAGPILVSTRPSRLVRRADEDSRRFLEQAASVLLELARRHRDGALRGAELPGLGASQPIRAYALGEDQSFLSLPLRERPRPRPDAAAEAREFQNPAHSPAMASHEFFFRSPPAAPPRLRYSGPYLDLGGRGLVATLSAGVRLDHDFVAVFALDLQFEVDWSEFLGALPEPARAARLHLSPPTTATWQPWSELAAALGADAEPSIREATERLAAREQDDARAQVPRRSLHHARTDDGSSVVALRLRADEWILLVVPADSPRWPWIAAGLTLGLLTLLLLAVERHRRHAVQRHAQAQRELSEKQGLLDTLQVPLVVVDPNRDDIVHANEAAAALGLRAGLRFGADLVSPEPAAQAHYHAMQIADSRPRRAYGVPLRLRDENGPREAYGLVRSVAVTAPIDALHADPRHRLGVVFELEREADLDLFLQPELARCRGEERARLGSLLDHGLDSLARVLAAGLADGSRDLDWLRWLASYLEARVEVLQWLLEHWDRPAPGRTLSLVGPGSLQDTLQRYREAFEHARDDARLRARLHWSNGCLAGLGPQQAVLDTRVDWRPDSCVPLPAEGLLGFFVGEALINAIQHGRAGSRPRAEFVEDRARGELRIRIENPRAEGRSSPKEDAGTEGLEPARKAYGGLRLLEQVARLCGWSPLRAGPEGALFRLEVEVPMARQRGD